MSPESSTGQAYLWATEPELRAHIEGLDTEGAVPLFRNLALMLAERIRGGVDPAGFVNDVESLLHDCQKGFNQTTGEQMPLGVTDIPTESYDQFRYFGRRLAYGAFGDQFGVEVELLFDAMGPKLEDLLESYGH